jgi:glucose-6-phosphate isomerase/transaldolase/glucose-6-phosphate isomerase
MPSGIGTQDPLEALCAPDAFRARVRSALRALDEAAVGARIRARDHTVWRADPREITDRLGWLDVASAMRRDAPGLRQWADGLVEEGVRDVVLLGMGGSSLAPEVFRRTFPRGPGRPRLHVLDSTSPAWIRRVSDAVDPRRVHVLVASKSGTTIEVETLFAHFRERVRAVLPSGWADRFSAITDPGTSLARQGAVERFRAVWTNPADIGGRFSALSRFGLVPAACLGLDLDRLLASAEEMSAACGADVPAARNPGAVLGAVLAQGVRDGRDKMTLLASPSLAAFGLWVEQLLAESTGKDGTGIVPVVDEPEVPVSAGVDRVFVALARARGEDPALEDRAERVRIAGHPLLRLETGDLHGLGGEMFRWEMATAVAGHLLGVHPFDQPDVQSAKTRTAEILRGLGEGRPPASLDPGDARTLLAGLRPPAWAAIMVYGDPDEELLAALAALRRAIAGSRGAATTLGLGPRFLHSTGQLHKGGPDSGTFVQILLDEPALPIPGRGFDFRELLAAQADGDLAALRERGRHVARLAPEPGPAAAVRELTAALSA